MDRNELGRQIERSLRKSLKTREAKALDGFISEGKRISDFPLIKFGWHLEIVKSDRIIDLAKKLSESEF